MDSYDLIVIGLGAHGSVIFDHFAGKCKVLGIELFKSPHTFGSHNGETRIVREVGYLEQDYVRMARRSLQLWQRLQDSTAEQVYVKCGGLSFGKYQDRYYKEHDLTNTNLRSLSDLTGIFGTSAGQVEWNFFDENAGYVVPERVIRLMIERALGKGGQISTNTKYVNHYSQGDLVVVETDMQRYSTKKLVLTIGTGLKHIQARIPGIRLEIQKQQLFFFDNAERHYPEMNIFLSEMDGTLLYGFPTINGQVKVGLHYVGPEVVYPELYDKVQNPEASVAKIREFLATYFPKLKDAKVLRAQTCLYTNTPDKHFIVDFESPKDRNTIIISACSGHGYKFSIVMGEVVEEMFRTNESVYKMFELKRFQRPNL